MNIILLNEHHLGEATQPVGRPPGLCGHLAVHVQVQVEAGLVCRHVHLHLSLRSELCLDSSELWRCHLCYCVAPATARTSLRCSTELVYQLIDNNLHFLCVYIFSTRVVRVSLSAILRVCLWSGVFMISIYL